MNAKFRWHYISVWSIVPTICFLDKTEKKNIHKMKLGFEGLHYIGTLAL